MKMSLGGVATQHAYLESVHEGACAPARGRRRQFKTLKSPEIPEKCLCGQGAIFITLWVRAALTAALTQAAALTQNSPLFTVIETPTFTRLWPDYWEESERGDFVSWLVRHPEAGDVIRGSGGCRKVRWMRSGTGKKGGVRVIYYNRLDEGVVHLLLIYAKNVRDDIDARILDRIRRTIDGEDD